MLLLFSLLSLATANPLPQVFAPNFYHTPYHTPYYQPIVYQPYQHIPAQPMVYTGQPVVSAHPPMLTDNPQFRTTWSAIMEENAEFAASAAIAAATGPPVVLAQSAKTLTGTAQVKQNPLTGNAAIYKLYLKEAVASTKYMIKVASACDDTAAAAGTTLVDVTTPFLLFNGAWVSGTTTAFNLNGGGTGTDLTGMRITVTDPAGAVIGCSTALA